MSDRAETTFDLSMILPITCSVVAVLLVILLVAYAFFCRQKPVQPTLMVEDGLVTSGLLPSTK